MFECVLNTPLKSFLPFYYSFLKNISSRSYLRISSSMYIAIIFIAKKNDHTGCNQNVHSFQTLQTFLNYFHS